MDYPKANRLLQNKQAKLINQIPLKYRDKIHKLMSTEYILSKLDEGYEPDRYKDEIKELIK